MVFMFVSYLLLNIKSFIYLIRIYTHRPLGGEDMDKRYIPNKEFQEIHRLNIGQRASSEIHQLSTRERHRQDNIDKINTSNRWQRKYKARYQSPACEIMTKEEYHKRMQMRDKTVIDRLNYLSDTYGFTIRHPRTKDIIRQKTSDVIDKHLLPRTAYRRVINRTEKKITITVEDGHLKDLQIDTDIRNTGQWKSVWYSKHNKRK